MCYRFSHTSFEGLAIHLAHSEWSFGRQHSLISSMSAQDMKRQDLDMKLVAEFLWHLFRYGKWCSHIPVYVWSLQWSLQFPVALQWANMAGWKAVYLSPKFSWVKHSSTCRLPAGYGGWMMPPWFWHLHGDPGRPIWTILDIQKNCLADWIRPIQMAQRSQSIKPMLKYWILENHAESYSITRTPPSPFDVPSPHLSDKL